MSDWTNITDTQLDPDAPLTSSLAYAWRENPIAIAEGSPGAPKIKVVHNVSAADAQTQTFTGLGDYSGISFEIKARNNSAAARTLRIEYSTNGGSTWSAVTTILSSSGNEQRNVSGAFNFATGLLVSVDGSSIQSSAPGRTSTTIAGASLAIDAIRFSWDNTNATLVAIITPNGGTV